MEYLILGIIIVVLIAVASYIFYIKENFQIIDPEDNQFPQKWEGVQITKDLPTRQLQGGNPKLTPEQIQEQITIAQKKNKRYNVTEEVIAGMVIHCQDDMIRQGVPPCMRAEICAKFDVDNPELKNKYKDAINFINLNGLKNLTVLSHGDNLFPYPKHCKFEYEFEQNTPIS